MISNSIRWRILFWYALILIASLAALGFALHDELESSLYKNADANIALWLGTIEHKIEEYPQEQLSAKIDAALPKEMIFEIWNEDDRLVALSPGLMESPRPNELGTANRDHFREHTSKCSTGEWIRLRKDIHAEHTTIQRFLQVLLAASAAIVALALAGGWFITTRALTSIEDMSTTARQISADNLSQRIEVTSVPNELEGLAKTLNGSFQRLEAAFERQTRFTADASHELRTPLAILQSHLELALTEDQGEAALLRRAQTCLTAGKRMNTIVEGLLTLARADSDGHEIALAPIDLASVVEDVAATLGPLASDFEVHIQMNLSPTMINADIARIRELVTNLIVNAVRYNRDQGEVHLSVDRDDQDAIFRVTDTGIGIAPDQQARIFERFYRIDPARSRSVGGSGLGLAITQWIVEQHHGSIEVESALRSGTTFTVRLPLESEKSLA